jgi:hypothetical protein
MLHAEGQVLQLEQRGVTYFGTPKMRKEYDLLVLTPCIPIKFAEFLEEPSSDPRVTQPQKLLLFWFLLVLTGVIADLYLSVVVYEAVRYIDACFLVLLNWLIHRS